MGMRDLGEAQGAGPSPAASVPGAGRQEHHQHGDRHIREMQHRAAAIRATERHALAKGAAYTWVDSVLWALHLSAW